MQEEIEEYPLTKVKLDDLVFDKSNPNRPSKEVIEGIRKSILEFGLVKPIVINEKMEIADGEHRALVWKALGKTDIQAYIVPRLNDDIKRRLARQTLNKLQGEHDIKLDADETALIFEAGQLNNLAELIAQGRESLENILTKHKGIEFQHEDNFDVDKALEDLVPETKLGDIWQLGQHRIICADCSDERSIKRLMEDKKADLILTDPPYNLSENMEGHYYANTNYNKMRVLEKTEWDQTFDIKPMLQVFLMVMSDNCTVYIFASQYTSPDIWAWMKDWSKFYSYLVYCKTDPMPSLSKKYWTWATELICFAVRGKQIHNYDEGTHNPNYILATKGGGLRTEHPTQKPIHILSEILKRSSNEESIIFDPFLRLRQYHDSM